MATIELSITCALAHVVYEANLLTRTVWSTDTPHVYGTRFVIDGTHPYLYENPAFANHVSGTTFIDTGRQLLKAISHLYYEVPLEARFVLHGLEVEFTRWAKLGAAVEATASLDMDEARRRPDARRTCRVEMSFSQEGQVVCKLRGSFTTLSKELEAKLMSMQLGQPPVARG